MNIPKKIVYKDKDIIISVDPLQYMLKWRKSEKEEYFVDLETIFREILNVIIKNNIGAKNVDQYKSILKSIQKAETRVKEIVKSIPYREIMEAPDVKFIHVEEYLSRDEPPII